MASSINTAIIGFGLSGRVFHCRVIKSLPEFRIHSVVTSRVEEVAAESPDAIVTTSAQEVFADKEIDLVVIATPNQEHAKLAIEALESGKHVVVEKPFAISANEARAVVECAKRSGNVLSVFHNRRWDNGFLTLKSLIGRNALGTLYQYEARYERFRPQVASNRWRESPQPGSGVLYDLGSHLIDQAYHLFGRPRGVFCDLRAQREGAATDDYFVILLDYGSLQVRLHAGCVVGHPGAVLQAHGDRGSFIKQGLDPQEEALKAGMNPATTSGLWGLDKDEARLYQVDVSGTIRPALIQTLAGSYHEFYRGVSKSINEGAPPPVLAEDGLAVVELIEMCALSAHEGRWVPCG